MRARCLAVLAFLVAAKLFALDIPPKPTQWVNDYGANLLTAAETQQLNEKLEGFYKKTGAQFLVLIWPSLQGEDDLEFTNRVANVWKVQGDKALMLFVFVKEHKTRIQVGYGLEDVITDAVSSRVLRETLAPYFRQSQYAAGLNAAIDELAKRVDPSWTSTTTTSTTALPPDRPMTRGTPGPSGSDIAILVVLFLIFIFVIVPMMRRGGCGGCSGCIFPMFWGGGGWGGGGTTFGGGGGGGFSVGGSWGGGGSSFGGGGAGGSW